MNIRLYAFVPFSTTPVRTLLGAALLSFAAMAWGLEAKWEASVLAIVGSEPITSVEVQQRSGVLQQMYPQESAQALQKRALEDAINDKLMLQTARKSGLKISDVELSAALLKVAQRGGKDEAGLQKAVEASGRSWERFRESIRDNLLSEKFRTTMLRELAQPPSREEVEVEVAKLKAANAAADKPSTGAAPSVKVIYLNLGHILRHVKEGASAQQVSQARAEIEKAQRLLGKKSFSALALAYSEAPEKAVGGELGLRPAQEYPELFLQATQGLKEGQHSAIVRSPAGFHLLKVIKREERQAPKEQAGNDSSPESNAASNSVTVLMHNPRHILIRAPAGTSPDEAKSTLAALKTRIEAGELSFAEAAKTFSQDASAAQGGDLGWVAPGQFVPEFEQVMEQLALNKISDPVVSRYGVHLIEVLGRREEVPTDDEVMEAATMAARSKKLQAAKEKWLSQLRESTYIEYRKVEN